MNPDSKKIVVLLKAYTKKEVRLMYGVSEDTFTRWLKMLPELAGSGRKNWLSVAEVEAIFLARGVPGEREFN